MPPPASAPPRTKVALCQLAVSRAPRPFLNRPPWNSSSWRGRPPRLLAGRAVEEIELRNARADQHRIGEMPGVVEGELKPSRRRRRRRAAAEAAASAAEAAAAAAAKPPRPPPRGPRSPLAPARRAGRRRPAPGRRRRRAPRRRSGRSRRAGRPGGALAAPAEAAAALAGLRLRADRKAEVEAPAQLRRSWRAKLTGRVSTRSSRPSESRWKRSGKAASISAVAAGKPEMALTIRLDV